MSRAVVLLALLLLVPVAAAQREMSVTMPASQAPRPVGGVGVLMHVETPDPTRMSFSEPWLLVGADNLVNVTVMNDLSQRWNGTFRVNVTGATAVDETLFFSLAPRARESRLIAIHPEDVGRVAIALESIDAFQPGGEPVSLTYSAAALPMPSVRYLDPPVGGAASEDDAFESFGMYGQSHAPGVAFVRVAPGDVVRARLQVRNDLPFTTPEFSVMLEGSRSVGPAIVPSLEPGRSAIVELPDFVPQEQQPGGGRFFGGMGQVELRAIGTFTVGGASVRAQLGEYRVENGVVRDPLPATALIEVQDGLSIELLVPRDPRLGVPTRVKINASNLGGDTQQGTLLVTVNTPNGLHYGVQGPESRSIHVDLAPGERAEEAIEFTPYVTGQWTLSTLFRSGEGFGYGGGGGYFNVEGPVRISFDRYGTEYARIGERVQVDLVVETEDTLQDAELRVAAGAGYRSYDMTSTSGQYQPGLAQRLLDVESSTAQLGTLRPGGAVNVTLEVAGRASGRFDVIPFVLSEGFAFTSRPHDPARDGFIDGPYYGGSGVSLAVQPRAVPTAVALAPLTVGLALFVGTWTMRTRFVK